MAEFKLSIIPSDPYFLPTQESIKKAKALIKRTVDYLSNDEIQVKKSDQPKFYTAADACESCVCPQCSAISYDPAFILEAVKAPDAMNYWVEMPCCGQRSLLRNVIFKDSIGRPTAAIGAFNLRITDYDDFLGEENIKKKIEKALGCSVIYLIEVHS